MTRILHVTDAFAPQVGGIETFVDGLARRQVAMGHDVTVLTSTPGATDESSAVGVLRDGWSTWSPRRLATSVDVVHAHLSVVSPLATRVIHTAVRSGIPVVASVHSLWATQLLLLRSISALAGWHRSPVLWAPVSAAAAADVRRVLPKAQLLVVPNAVDVAWWRRPLVPHQELTLLSVGRLSPRKRPLQLVRMLHAVERATQGSQVRAIIVGSGPLYADVARELRQRGMDSWVTLTGMRSPPQIRELCASSDIYVAPATLESFGIAALEARAVGLPIVAMRSGGVREFVTDGVEGILCANDHEMADALTSLILDPACRRRICEHNQAVAPRADWTQTLALFEEAYTSASQLARPKESPATAETR